MSRFACIASLVTTAPSSGSGASSGRKWVISFALRTGPCPARSRCRGWVTAASSDFLVRAGLAPCALLPSTATAWRPGLPRIPRDRGIQPRVRGGPDRRPPAPRGSRRCSSCFRFFSSSSPPSAASPPGRTRASAASASAAVAARALRVRPPGPGTRPRRGAAAPVAGDPARGGSSCPPQPPPRSPAAPGTRTLHPPPAPIPPAPAHAVPPLRRSVSRAAAPAAALPAPAPPRRPGAATA